MEWVRKSLPLSCKNPILCLSRPAQKIEEGCCMLCFGQAKMIPGGKDLLGNVIKRNRVMRA